MARFFVCQTEKEVIMMLYIVTWNVDSTLTKGKGRVTADERRIYLAVLCDSIVSAQRCFQYYFDYEFKSRHSLYISDGELSFKRSLVDSRSFHPHYLMLDKMDIPISLTDPVSSLILYSKKYSSPRL